MATLMKGLIPIEMLAQMPLPFVHYLRDIRVKQIEAKRQHQEAMSRQAMNNSQRSAPNQQMGAPLDEAAIEELVDGLT
jgi:hypothetical protein